MKQRRNSIIQGGISNGLLMASLLTVLLTGCDLGKAPSLRGVGPDDVPAEDAPGDETGGKKKKKKDGGAADASDGQGEDASAEQGTDAGGANDASAPSDGGATVDGGATPADSGTTMPPVTGGFQLTIVPLLNAQGCTECHHAGKPYDLTRYPFAGGDPAMVADKLIASMGTTMPPAPRDKVPADIVEKVKAWKAGGMKP